MLNIMLLTKYMSQLLQISNIPYNLIFTTKFNGSTIANMRLKHAKAISS